MKKILALGGIVLVVLVVGTVVIMIWGTGMGGTFLSTQSRVSGLPATESGASAGIGFAQPSIPGVATKDMALGMPIYQPPGATAEDRAVIESKIIKNGALTVRVDDAERRLEELKSLATAAGGFVADAHLTADQNGVKTAYVTLRVPSAKFDQTVANVKKLSILVLDESSNTQDVTAQFVDLDARLRAAKAEETQYLAILKKAGTIEDTLNVTARLADVRTRIEQLQGQMRYLTEQTDYATLSVTMTEAARVEVPTRAWKPLETIKQSLQQLVIALQILVDVLITMIIFLIGFLLPLFLVLFAIYWILHKLWHRVFGGLRDMRKRK